MAWHGFAAGSAKRRCVISVGNVVGMTLETDGDGGGWLSLERKFGIYYCRRLCIFSPVDKSNETFKQQAIYLQRPISFARMLLPAAAVCPGRPF
jgi:hypothetical protein